VPGWKSAAVAVLATVAIVPATLRAHRLDEYLQAARIGIADDRVDVDIDLTPGASVADRVFATIDRDHDGRISADEADRYAHEVLADMTLERDGVALPLTLSARVFPDVERMREGVGTIQVSATSPAHRSGSGAHEVRFRNAHRPDISIYLANALAPAVPSIDITRQTRDVQQRELRIDYRTGVNAPGRVLWPGAAAAFATLVTLLIVRRTSSNAAFVRTRGRL
jgi:hypothetical protein